jgi:hypothetical protein
MFLQLSKDFLKRFLGEWLRRGLARVGSGSTGEQLVQRPTAVVEAEAGDVVIRGHQVEIDDPFDPWSGPGYWLQ